MPFYLSGALRGLSHLLTEEITDPRTCGRVSRVGTDGARAGQVNVWGWRAGCRGTVGEKEGVLAALACVLSPPGHEGAGGRSNGDPPARGAEHPCCL